MYVNVHINESLTTLEIYDIEKGLSSNRGIVSTCIHDKTPHLMIVDYDPKLLTSTTLLGYVAENDAHAPPVVGT